MRLCLARAAASAARSRASRAGLAAALAILAVAGLGAESPGSGALPDFLLLEISTAPGYIWMGGCGEPGAPQIPAARAEPAGAPEGGHLSHHPGAPSLAPSLSGSSESDQIIAELERAISLFGGPTSQPR